MATWRGLKYYNCQNVCFSKKIWIILSIFVLGYIRWRYYTISKTSQTVKDLQAIDHLSKAEELKLNIDNIIVDNDNQRQYTQNLNSSLLKKNYHNNAATFNVNTPGNLTREINILIVLTNTKSNSNLIHKFKQTISSLLKFSSVPIVFYIIVDKSSHNIAEDTIIVEGKYFGSTNNKVLLFDIEEVVKDINGVVMEMKKYFTDSSSYSYYAQSLFFLSIAIHQVSALSSLDKLIMLDSDLKFESDIKNLYHHFSQFQENQIIGIAHENQPIYRHGFSYYRSLNPGTRVGDPPPNGLTGFNSGVLLLDISKIKTSEVYKSAKESQNIARLTKKYHFKGHLGDQDLYTLLSTEHEELFYILPCTWNRQLCVWWRDNGYEDVFDSYFNCVGKINLYHGNCNTLIP